MRLLLVVLLVLVESNGLFGCFICGWFVFFVSFLSFSLLNFYCVSSCFFYFCCVWEDKCDCRPKGSNCRPCCGSPKIKLIQR